MEQREWQVGLVGTFDLENYGDLLFPLIAEEELGRRLGRVRLHRFSYHDRSAPAWPYPVHSITELPRLAAGLDGLLVGGGLLIRFDKQVAPGYGPPTTAIHHPTGYWLTPALIALQHGVPLIWNAPGVDCDRLPAWADPLMELAFSLSSYVAVRDEPSRTELGRFVDPERIAVVPDTAFGVGGRSAGEVSFELARLRDAAGLRGRYVVVQATDDLEAFLRFLDLHAERLQELRFVALPIGPVLGDDAARLAGGSASLVHLPTWPPPLLLAELIRHAAAVVGTSYHLAITALAAGVPVFRPPNFTGKYAALAAFDGIYPLPGEDDPDAAGFISRLGPLSPAPQIQSVLDRLQEHWDRVASVVVAGPTAAPAALDRFWQSLPGLLEAAADRCAGADAALRRQRQVAAALEDERQSDRQRLAELAAQASAFEDERARQHERAAELSRLLELARAEIVSRDRGIEALHESTSWRVTAPLRSIGRRLKR